MTGTANPKGIGMVTGVVNFHLCSGRSWYICLTMKRNIALLVLLSMFGGFVFAGCGESPAPTPPAPNPPAATNAPAPK